MISGGFPTQINKNIVKRGFKLVLEITKISAKSMDKYTFIYEPTLENRRHHNARAKISDYKCHKKNDGKNG
jgi:hypothetical protein